MDAFFRGCQNKFAALMASGQQCKSLYQAVRRTKANLHDQKIIGKPSFGVRQVSFQEEKGSPVRPGTAGVLDMEALAKVIATTVKEAMSVALRSSPNRFGNSGSPRQCFACKKEGHIIRDCPDRASTPPRSPERPPIKCYSCGKPGHISRNCLSSPKAGN